MIAKKSLLLLPGDGIGPEVMGQAGASSTGCKIRALPAS